MAEFVYTNDIKQIFPWYSDIKRQNRYHPDRTDCYQLVGFLPFVVSFKIAGLGLVPTQWGIYDEKDTLKVNLTSKLSLIHTYYSSSPDADGFYSVWGIYFGDYLGIDIPCGYYYSKLLYQGIEFNSEFFYMPSNPGDYNLYIEWSNSSDILGIPYQTGFKQWVFLKSALTKMSPEVQEEGVEDGQGRFYPTSQRFIDNFHFDEWGPQYFINAMSTLPMHDNVNIRRNFKPIVENPWPARNIKVTSTFDALTDFGLLDVVFQGDAAQYSGACSDNFKLSGGSAATCNIVITNLSVTGTGNTKTFLFTPLQNGQAPINVLRYEWRSPQKNNGNWQSIDLNNTFASSFTTGQNTVGVRAICPNSVSDEVTITFTVSLPTSQCPAGIQVYDVVYDPITADQRPVGIYYSLTGVTTNAKFVEIRAPEISEDWQRFAITPSGAPQYIYYPDSTVPGEYAVQMRVVCVISGTEYLSANTNFVITLQ